MSDDLEFLEKTEGELFELLGSHVPNGGLLGGSGNRKLLRVRASNWWEQKSSTILDAVCKSPNIQKIVAKESTDEKELFLALIDTISVLTLGVPVAIIAAICLKKGLKVSCASRWGTA
ncbi:hypothetical protein ELH26_14390 [Rhizobium leguminosarum]|uniref:hypothetical protein n=1 Tax=Rhizobium leguminosarum TaxID=384 RepID=UPI00102F48C1|nr:hypothetical protein [Rhizobium leguminosarum]TBC95135.1 hypothetical protein ELH26_14390 [Rhizobium leguminosarum]